MKIRDGFMSRQIAGQWVVVPLGERVVEFNGIMSLSESGALLWKLMEKETAEDDLVQVILQEYDIDENTARTDVRNFVADLSEKGLLE